MSRRVSKKNWGGGYSLSFGRSFGSPLVRCEFEPACILDPARSSCAGERGGAYLIPHLPANDVWKPRNNWGCHAPKMRLSSSSNPRLRPILRTVCQSPNGFRGTRFVATSVVWGVWEGGCIFPLRFPLVGHFRFSSAFASNPSFFLLRRRLASVRRSRASAASAWSGATRPPARCGAVALNWRHLCVFTFFALVFFISYVLNL